VQDQVPHLRKPKKVAKNPKKVSFLISETHLVNYDARMKLFISATVLFVGIAVFALSPAAQASRHGIHHAKRIHRKKDGHSKVTHHPYKVHHRHTSTVRRAPKASVLRTHRAVTRRRLTESPQPCPVALALPQKAKPSLGSFAAAAATSNVALAENTSLARASPPSPIFAQPSAQSPLRPQYHPASTEMAMERPAPPAKLRSPAEASDYPEETESAPLRMRPVFHSSQSRNAPEKDTREPVTLIYKDGRAEKILNYLLSPTLLCILDGNRDSRFRDIPVEELDLEATQKANLAVGIDFSLPKAAE
jgi:hypothetical protein